MTQILEVMLPVIKLMNTHRISNIKELPGLLEFDIDNEWHLTSNGHDEPIEPKPPREGVKIAPYSFVVWHNGFPAGTFTPFDESWVAGYRELFMLAIANNINDTRNKNEY